MATLAVSDSHIKHNWSFSDIAKLCTGLRTLLKESNLSIYSPQKSSCIAYQTVILLAKGLE